MTAVNSLLLFLLPSVLILGAVVATSEEYSDYTWDKEFTEQESARCPPGQHFDRCHYHCQQNCSEWNKGNVPFCPAVCRPGCVCDEGTIRETSIVSKCIKPENCPSSALEEESEDAGKRKCPPKEHFSKCQAHCQKNCTNINENPALCPQICVGGCVCNKGYVRAANGQCIKPRDCLKVKDSCPPGQHFDECLYSCQKNCSNWNQTTIACNLICKPGCICNEGTVRESHSDSKCIKPEQCKSTGLEASSEVGEESIEETEQDSLFSFCPQNEMYSPCGARCERDCSNKNESNVTCSDLCSSGCKCKEGYVRGPKGKCIKPSQCPDDDNTKYPAKRICPRNEVWSSCRANCQKNCTNSDKVLPCHFICSAGCICEKGLIRGYTGKCVAPKYCPNLAEELEVGSQEEDWEQQALLEEQWKQQTLLVEKMEESSQETNLNSGESQKSSFEEFCPPNEEYSACKSQCEKDCKSKEQPRGCNPFCTSGCKCKEGYVRGPEGNCIEPEECPAEDIAYYPVKRVCPEFEVWDHCRTTCQKNCTNIQNQHFCPLMCIAGCVCETDLIRGPTGKCISKQMCPEVKEESKQELSSLEEQKEAIKGLRFCPPHEQFIACYGHCEKDCSNKESAFPPCPKFCVSECRCLYGYVRGPNGTCIKPIKCPTKDNTKYPVKRLCPKDERWDPSTAHCQKNCTNMHKSIPCPKISVAGCVCKKGLYRARDGKCVPRNQCPKYREMSEQWKVSVENEDASAESDIMVEEMENVQRAHFCPRHERFAYCHGHCERDCSTRNTTVECSKFCISECKCKLGYVRGPKGTCILPSKCPSEDTTKYPVKRVCPRNERWETAKAHCQKTCRNADEEVPCLDIALAGCVCKEGFYRRVTGECVPKRQCSKSEYLNFCPEHEQFNRCFGHCEKDCSNKGTSLLPCPKYCVSECKCMHSFVRGPNGTCIQPDECPSEDNTKYPVKRVCPKHEHWEKTTAHCQKDCKTINKDIPCLRIAVEGCVCDEGLYRRRDGKCVLPEKCFKKRAMTDESVSLENEEAVLDQMNDIEETLEEISENIEHSDDYLTTSIPVLPVFICGRNGYLSFFHRSCPDNCTNYLDKERKCPMSYTPMCLCDKGYVRGPDGDCIKPENCPDKVEHSEYEDGISAKDRMLDETEQSLDELSEDSENQELVSGFCPPNEEYSKCTAHCERDCKNWRESDVPCIQLCVPGCVCRPGFVRGPRGRCVESSRCPAKLPVRPTTKVCPRDEVWSLTDAHCQQNCSTFTDLLPCLRLDIPGCICKKGWIRGPEGRCIKPKDCPAKEEEMEEDAFLPIPKPVLPGIVCGRNEILSVCHSSCPDNCTNYMEKKKCLPICIPACICASGYVKGPNGDCIKPDKCPKDKKPEDCTELEYYDTCGTACEKNCSNINLPDQTCDKSCIIGCFCLPGYVRGPKGDCIWPFDCTRQSTLSGETELPVEGGGCPNTAQCIVSCRRRGRRYGRCIGRFNLICSCG